MNYFITFSDKKYISPRKRILNQANYLSIFNKIIEYDEEYLKSESFWEQHSNFIINNERGYGYWLWKPYIILKTLEKMNDGDVLLYCDCGCELEYKNKDLLIELFNITRKDFIVGSYTTHDDISYCKYELINHFDIPHELLFKNQHQATSICIYKCSKTIDIITEWYNTCCMYNFINDTLSMFENKYFIENRHDQSVFSLITKKYNIFSTFSLESCICLARNKSEKTKKNLPGGSWIHSAIDYFIIDKECFIILKNNKNKAIINIVPAYSNICYDNIDGNLRPI